MSAQNFVDPFSSQFQNPSLESNPILNRDIVYMSDDANERVRDLYLSNIDRDYERAATNSARAWDEYMDSTKTQRLVKDLEAAGLNPWLAIQSGISSGGSSNSASSGSSARSKSTSSHKSNSFDLKTLAIFMLASARLISALA